MQVIAGKANYVGDLYIDYESRVNPDVCILPYKIKNRPTQGAEALAL